MQASFTGISKITLEPNPDGKSSKHIATDIRLELSKNQDKSDFLDFKGRPKEGGIKPLTQTFIQGLVANIHHAHGMGWWDSAAHLRYVIDEITRGFATVAKSYESEMTDD